MSPISPPRPASRADTPPPTVRPPAGAPQAARGQVPVHLARPSEGRAGATGTATAAQAELLRHYTVYYGGSFDPGHWGHVQAAVALLQRGADELWLAPTQAHADKQHTCPFWLRLVQCNALADEIDRQLPAALRGRIRVTDVEGRVASHGQTVVVMEHLVASYPERRFALAMGSDCLEKAPSWQGWDRLQALARVVVLDRPGFLLEHPAVIHAPMPDISSTLVRRALGAQAPGGSAGQALLPAPPTTLDQWVPPAIAALIRAHQLYAAPEAGRALAATASGASSGLPGHEAGPAAALTPPRAAAALPPARAFTSPEGPWTGRPRSLNPWGSP